MSCKIFETPLKIKGIMGQSFFQLFLILGIKIDHLHGDSNEADRAIAKLVRDRTELKSVEVNGSNCTDKALQLLLHHPTIKIIRLSGTSKVTGDIQILPSLTSSTVVEVLDLSGCSDLNRFDVLLNSIRATLRILNLSRNKIPDTGALADFAVLEELNLSNCRMRDANLTTFLDKTKETLRILNISRNYHLCGIGFMTISFLMLEELHLAWCQSLPDAGIIGFLNKVGATLKILDLSHTQVSDLDSLATSFLVLEELNLANCRGLTDAGIIGFLNKTGGALKKLNLRSNPCLSFSSSLLNVRLPVLEELTLSSCRSMTDAGLNAFLSKIGPNLRILKLRRTCVLFEIECLPLPVIFPDLEELDLSGSVIQDAGVIKFLNRTGSNLRILDLSQTPISLSGVESLAVRFHFPVLEMLNLHGCRKVTEVGLIAFLDRASGDLTIVGHHEQKLDTEIIKNFFPKLKLSVTPPVKLLPILV